MRYIAYRRDISHTREITFSRYREIFLVLYYCLWIVGHFFFLKTFPEAVVNEAPSPPSRCIVKKKTFLAAAVQLQSAVHHLRMMMVRIPTVLNDNVAPPAFRRPCRTWLLPQAPRRQSQCKETKCQASYRTCSHFAQSLLTHLMPPKRVIALGS
jgi:hypothetical protein